jgi:hypothetical protein
MLSCKNTCLLAKSGMSRIRYTKQEDLMRIGYFVCAVALAALGTTCAQENPLRPESASVSSGSMDARIGGVPGSHGGRPLSTTLTGAEEAPGPGDPDGSGEVRLTLNHGQGQVCFEITVDGIILPATGAHIHRAPAGVAGPIVVPLTAPSAAGTSRGCVNANQDLIKDIIQNPDAYYANVHDEVFSAGAIRGQLSK